MNEYNKKIANELLQTIRKYLKGETNYNNLKLSLANMIKFEGLDRYIQQRLEDLPQKLDLIDYDLEIGNINEGDSRIKEVVEELFVEIISLLKKLDKC